MASFQYSAAQGEAKARRAASDEPQHSCFVVLVQMFTSVGIEDGHAYLSMHEVDFPTYIRVKHQCRGVEGPEVLSSCETSSE